MEFSYFVHMMMKLDHEWLQNYAHYFQFCKPFN